MDFKYAFEVDETTFLKHFESFLSSYLDGEDSVLNDAARYAAFGGGKRVRPYLVYLGALAAGGKCDEDVVLRLATAIELVHSYSLVHDDLPAMDNAAERRGKPSVHVAFGEANGVLAGDILLTYAADIIAQGAHRYGSSFAAAAREITLAALQMAHGQAIELGGCHDEKAYLKICEKKTGALILAALRAGAVAASADEETLRAVTEYGKAIGLCFQLSDDLIDNDGIVALIGRKNAKELLDRTYNSAANAMKGDARFENFARKIAFREA